MSKVLDNKFIKFLLKFIKVIVWIFVLLVIFVILVQRIFNNQVSIGSYRMFTVVTGSMDPVYKVGDVVISKEVDPSTINEGDDVVYLGEKNDFKDKIVTHQVIMIEKENDNYRIQTKGIANTKADPEITQNEVIGKVIYKMGALSLLQRAMSNNYVFFFIVFVPIVLLTFRQFIKSRLDDDDEDEDEENDENERGHDKKHKITNKTSNKDKTKKE